MGRAGRVIFLLAKASAGVDSGPVRTLGDYLFRTRNALFPALLAALLIVLPPRPLGEPFADALALAGLALALLGQALRVLTIGLDYVKRGGKRKRVYADRLVTGGLYAHCRNPMYTGNVLIALGALMIAGNPWALAIGGVFVVFAYSAIIAAEETYLRDRFGDHYAAFVRRTPRWWVRPRGLSATIRAFRFDWPGVVVKEYSTLFTTAMLLTLIVAVKAWRADRLDTWAPGLISAGALWISLFAWARFLKKGKNWRARGRTLRDDTLTARRRRIDLIDTALLDLLNQRAIEVGEIFQWKDAEGVPRVDEARMGEMLDRLVALNPGPLTDADARALLGGIVRHFAHEFEPSNEPAPESISNPDPKPTAARTPPAVAASSGAAP